MSKQSSSESIELKTMMDSYRVFIEITTRQNELLNKISADITSLNNTVEELNSFIKETNGLSETLKKLLSETVMTKHTDQLSKLETGLKNVVDNTMVKVGVEHGELKRVQFEIHDAINKQTISLLGAFEVSEKKILKIAGLFLTALSIISTIIISILK